MKFYNNMNKGNIKGYILIAVAVFAGLVIGGILVSGQVAKLVIPDFQFGAAGDTASSTRSAIASARTASTTWCHLYNEGSRDRFILGWILFKNATSSGAVQVMAATSSVPSGSSASSSALFNVNLNNSVMAGFAGWINATSTTDFATSTIHATSSGHLLLWPTRTYLKFIASSSLNTTESGLCGVEYVSSN